MGTVGVLGPVLVRDGETPLPLGGPRQRRLLARLLLQRPHPVALDALVESVFGPRPPRRAAATLRTYVTRLRRALPEAIEVTAEPPGYALRVGDGWTTDVVRFERLVARAERQLAHREHRAAAASLTAALALWRGRPFDDIADETWAAPDVRRLEEARTAARERLVEALVGDHRPGEALPVVDRLIRADPYNEAHRLRRASTLSGAGRALDALEELRSFRHQLAHELGVGPSPELHRLQQAISREGSDHRGGALLRLGNPPARTAWNVALLLALTRPPSAARRVLAPAS